MKGYKAFRKDLKCLDMQYEIGKEYTFDGKPILCQQGFHFCKDLVNCYNYYDMTDDTRICEISATGDIISDSDGKYCTNKIKIIREIKNPRIKSNVDKSSNGYCNSGYKNSGNWNSGDYNSGNWNSGDYNSGYRNSGYKNSGDYNSGYYNSGYCNSGYCNSGDCNSGNKNSGNKNSGNKNSGYGNSSDCNSGNRNTSYYNSGNRNSGHCNSGDCNSGNKNSGDWNSGNCNSGDSNSGDWNSGNCSSGVFNTEKKPKIKIFDKESEWTIQDWTNSNAYRVMSKCPPHSYSEYIMKSEMSDKEKNDHPEYRTIGGYTKTFIFTDEDRQMWWNDLPENEKQAIYDLPNFNAEKFKECTGIHV